MTATEMAACGWLRGLKALTAREVKALPNGCGVLLIGPDRHGEKSATEGIVVQHGTRKLFLTLLRDHFTYKTIREYPGKVWAVKDS